MSSPCRRNFVFLKGPSEGYAGACYYPDLREPGLPVSPANLLAETLHASENIADLWVKPLPAYFRVAR
jgi:hypothetical protein